jgi:pre-mRNA-splicing factor SYF1
MYLDDIDTVLVDDKREELIRIRDLQGRRAVVCLPKSYKLWKIHWEFSLAHFTTNTKQLLGMWETCLQTLHKFPRVWMEYLKYAHSNASEDPTFLRRLANRCLEALPVTQHAKIWPILLNEYQVAGGSTPKETKLCILRRYIQFHPPATKEIADFLANSLGQMAEASSLYIDLLSSTTQNSLQKKELWMSLAKICTTVEINEIDFDALTRSTLAQKKQFGLQELEGVVWNQLAEYYIRRGEFQLARSIYEEAMQQVSKVRDFTILLDAYLQFEEGLLEATMQAQEDDQVDDETRTEIETDEEEQQDDWDILLEAAPSSIGDNHPKRTSMADLELALARAEDLTTRRPLLLNQVLLRQNPHDVGEWLKRARLFQENEQVPQAAAALEEALTRVNARRAVNGNPSQMVLDLIKIYESMDVAKARDLLDRICRQWIFEFKNVDDLAECHAAWVELELKEEAWDDGLDIIRQSIVPPNTKDAPKMVKGLKKSLRLWDLLLDLEESLGTMQTTKDAYHRAMECRVATPMHILNFASYLKEQKYFEESFSAYEKGVELFDYPGVKVIWKSYLTEFTKRYGGEKVERLRDLYQRCLEQCPPESSSEFFLMQGQLEEEFGLTKRALQIYKQMCQTIPENEKYTAYQLWIAKTIKYMGKTACRDIYQSAITGLPEEVALPLTLDFAKLEISLQELDRARLIFKYGAQMADPARAKEFWQDWNEFEISHGNEETFRDMLRIKRSVEASFSTVNYNAAGMNTDPSANGGDSAGNENLSEEQAMKMIAERDGIDLPEGLVSNKPLTGFVSASKRSANEANLQDINQKVAKLRKALPSEEQQKDADEIDLDDEDEEEDAVNEEDEVIQNVTTKAVPAAVFGGLAAEEGALERLRAANDKKQ